MVQMQPQVCQKKPYKGTQKQRNEVIFSKFFCIFFFIFLSLYRMVKNVETLKSRNHNTLQF